jgi:hypothetical protein
MNVDDVRSALKEIRQDAERRATERKDSMFALEVLFDGYSALHDERRTLAEQVLAEWVLSPDEVRRYDGIALIRKFRVRSAVPALQALARRLESETTPGAPFELAKVRTLMAELMGM